jgi:hypothetical protein
MAATRGGTLRDFLGKIDYVTRGDVGRRAPPPQREHVMP